MMSVMSRFRKNVLRSAPARAHRLWPLCGTSRSPSFIDKGLLKLLLPDVTLLLIPVKLFASCFPEESPCNNSQALLDELFDLALHRASLQACSVQTLAP